MAVSSNLARKRSERVLQGLRDEIFSGYTSGPNSLLRHAMRLVSGEVRSELESLTSWTDYAFVKPGQTVYPIRKCVGSQVDQCYYGHADEAAIARFENQSERLFIVAMESLGSQGDKYRQPLPGVAAWVSLCYCLAWDHPYPVDYKIWDDGAFRSACHRLRDSVVALDAPVHADKPIEVSCFATLSGDVRSCSFSAVNAILSLSAERDGTSGIRRRQDPAIEDRNRWVYEQARDGTPHKNIQAELNRRDDPVTIQRIGQIVREYAARNDLPLVEATRGRRPVRRPGRLGSH